VTGIVSLLVLGLLAGVDNLQVGAGLGLAGLRPARRLALGAAFMVCETGMPLVGLALGRLVERVAGPWAEGIGTLVLALCGGLIAAAALRSHPGNDDQVERFAAGPLALVVLPVSLSFDNLFVGLGLGSLGYPVVLSALAIGGISGGLGCLGLFTGARLRRWLPARAEIAELWSGAYLVVLAAFRLAHLVKDFA
jgi:putative Mn2+ efflux pump MntP